MGAADSGVCRDAFCPPATRGSCNLTVLEMTADALWTDRLVSLWARLPADARAGQGAISRTVGHSVSHSDSKAHAPRPSILGQTTDDVLPQRRARNSHLMADQKAVLDKHLSGAAAGNAAQPRADALNAIATLSADNKNKAGFWAEVTPRKVLVEAPRRGTAGECESRQSARSPTSRAMLPTSRGCGRKTRCAWPSPLQSARSAFGQRSARQQSRRLRPLQRTTP